MVKHEQTKLVIESCLHPRTIAIEKDLTDMNFFLINRKAVELWEFQKQQSDMCNNCGRENWTDDLDKVKKISTPHEFVIEPLPKPIKQIRIDGCLMDPMSESEIKEFLRAGDDTKRYRKQKQAYDRAFNAWLNDAAENEYPKMEDFFD